MKPEIRIFPNGQVSGKPGARPLYRQKRTRGLGFDWQQAFSQRSDAGVSNPMRISDWRAIAKRDGAKLVVCNERHAMRDGSREWVDADFVRELEREVAKLRKSVERLRGALVRANRIIRQEREHMDELTVGH